MAFYTVTGKLVSITTILIVQKSYGLNDEKQPKKYFLTNICIVLLDSNDLNVTQSKLRDFPVFPALRTLHRSYPKNRKKRKNSVCLFRLRLHTRFSVFLVLQVFIVIIIIIIIIIINLFNVDSNKIYNQCTSLKITFD